MDSDQDMLREIYRLTKENNTMLRKVRRSAFISNLFSFIFYAALFAAPIWFYMTYLSGSVDRLMKTMNQVQSAGQQTQSQFQAMQNAWHQFQTKMPNYGASSTSSNH